jgi:hypothetical protein
MVMVPERAEPVLAATEYPTAPLPTPELPEVMVIQPALLTADHAAVDDEDETETLPGPPEAAKLADVGVSENDAAAAAACVTVNDIPAIVMDPDRAVVAVFAATE